VRAADGAFVSLADLLRPEPGRENVAPAVVTLPVAMPAPLPDAAELAREVRVFRARLADAFDAACDALLREFAYAVLGRELILAPVDIAAIAARVLAEHPGAQPLRLRVAPGDVPTLARAAGALPPIAGDTELAPGDAVLEFAGGSIDARLGIRLAALLEQPA
jgi:flagellar biosynthesis/type III secretory pathway protein FliH